MKPSIDEVKREHREKKSKIVLDCWELWPVGVLNLLGFFRC